MVDKLGGASEVVRPAISADTGLIEYAEGRPATSEAPDAPAVAASTMPDIATRFDREIEWAIGAKEEYRKVDPATTVTQRKPRNASSQVCKYALQRYRTALRSQAVQQNSDTSSTMQHAVFSSRQLRSINSRLASLIITYLLLLITSQVYARS